LRRYYPAEVSARTAAYYALPEHLALLRLRSEAESRMLRWNDVADDLRRHVPELPLRASECTAFTNAYEMEVLLHEAVAFPEQDEAQFDLIAKTPIRRMAIAASFLLPYWTATLWLWRRNKAGEISVVPGRLEGPHTTRVLNAATKVLVRHGWKRMPASLAQTKIPDIDLKHVPLGDVRVADVIFGVSPPEA
jgi:hypothetical protein